MTKHMKKIGNFSRRQVLVGSAAGAGLVIGYSILPQAVDSASKAIAAGNWDHQQYLTMDADGKAYVYVTKCEIGQHVGTALAQAVAEELEINWEDVNVIYPDSHAKWGLMISFVPPTVSARQSLRTLQVGSLRRHCVHLGGL